MPPILRALRPGQWTKNLFVLAPLVFGKAVTDPQAVVRTLIATAAFCLVASALYLVNDVMDREADGAHPVKRHRPVASGAVSTRLAIATAILLLLTALGATAFLVRPALPVLLGYAGVTTAYSLVLKRIALLDVFVIAGGFVLRVLTGSAAASVVPSHWLLMCTFFLALFLGLSKRRTELAHRGSSARASLDSVPLPLFEAFENVAMGVTIVCYAIYTVAPETTKWFGTDGLMLTVPFVVFGMFRWRLLEVRGKGEDAASDLFTDRGLLLTVLLWGLVASLVIYTAS
jgi:4-hydroxybenzoate polyprenyltransferase